MAALKVLETRRRTSCQGASRWTTPASRGSCGPKGSKFLFTFLLSAILIYLVLAAQFESFRDPFIVLAGSVPAGAVGALLFSFLGFTTLNIYSQSGLITLVGLIAKNGILIVEFANKLQEQGRDKVQAVIEAAETRLRPILMTTAATVHGTLPLVFASGPEPAPATASAPCWSPA
jgi:multidrug efflux pump